MVTVFFLVLYIEPKNEAFFANDKSVFPHG